MKKLLNILALSAVTLTANAQSTVQGSNFCDNWSVGFSFGGISPIAHSKILRNMRATYGVEMTKQITPGFALGTQFMASNNTTPGRNTIDATNWSLLGKFNLTNLFCGYTGTPRPFEMVAVGGIGWGHFFYPETTAKDHNFMTTKIGMDFDFNLGQKKAWTISLRPVIVYDMTHRTGGALPAFNVNNSALEITAGVVYHFKNRNNGKHHMTLLKAYDQAEVDALNAKINDLRQQVDERDQKVSEQGRQINQLNKDLEEARNKKPVTQTVTQTVTKTSASLEQTITFRQGRSTIDASQMPNVERIASFLRNHKDATVDIKGYASPEGNAEVNARIAKQRAESVKKTLVNRYKIAENRITAEGQGVGNMFSEDDWNRVSICTINESK